MEVNGVIGCIHLGAWLASLSVEVHPDCHCTVAAFVLFHYVVFGCTDVPPCVLLEMDVRFVHFATLRESAHRSALARVCCAHVPRAHLPTLPWTLRSGFPRRLSQPMLLPPRASLTLNRGVFHFVVFSRFFSGG